MSDQKIEFLKLLGSSINTTTILEATPVREGFAEGKWIYYVVRFSFAPDRLLYITNADEAQHLKAYLLKHTV